MSEPSSRICILGGGFGGLYTALRLSQFPWEPFPEPEITLVDRGDRFLFSPLLYELVTEELQTWEIAPTFEDLLAGTPIRFQQATVTGIDIESRQVQLADSANLTYDQLVIAIGGKTPLDGVPGAKDCAIPFRTLADALRLKQRLRLLEESDAEKIRIAIVGGGYSGVELACKLADRLGERGRIRIVERGETILSNSAQFNQEAATKALEARRIWVDLETEVTSIEPESLSLNYKGQVDTIPVNLVLWTVGNQVSELMQTLPLKQSPRGLLLTEPTLQVLERREIFALGDAAECREAAGQSLPATAQVALQQADYCAWNLWASLTGRTLLPFRYQPLGEMLALGTDSAAVSGFGLQFDGLLGYLARRLVYLYRLPTLSQQLAVGVNWLAQPLLEWLSDE
jgi:NADH dehydrogenase